MRLITYLFRKQMFLIYGMLSVLIAFLFALTVHGNAVLFAKMVCIIFLLLWILRVQDDIQDYETDRLRKMQPLTKRQLTIVLVVLITVWSVLHLISYGITGLLCLAVLSCTLLWKRIPILKIFFLALLVGMYWIFNSVEFCVWHTIILVICPIISITYATIKKRKHYEHTSEEYKSDD